MLECLIIGDSIAVGIGQVRKECKLVARTGINSTAWLNKNLVQLTASKVLIISLGANDTDKINTKNNLTKIRTRAVADRVYWILPNENLKPEQLKAVTVVATEFGDIVVPRPTANISRDGVHPTRKGYKELAENLK
jgi:lysophospholipase L1-like esterase